jgi:hypothetical protein
MNPPLDDQEREADGFAIAVLCTVIILALVGLALLATNRWPT